MRDGASKRKSVDSGDLDPRVQCEEEEAMDIDQIEALVGEWVHEVQECGIEKVETGEWLDFLGEWEEVEGGYEGVGQEAWDDVHGGGLPLEKVMAARAEEVGFMEERGI